LEVRTPPGANWTGFASSGLASGYERIVHGSLNYNDMESLLAPAVNRKTNCLYIGAGSIITAITGVIIFLGLRAKDISTTYTYQILPN
jgi:hypothetical protein